MKHQRQTFSRCATGLLVAIVAQAAAAGPLPPSASLQLVPNTITHTASLIITNPGDQVWVIQKSADLQNWSGGTAWKIHNGRFRIDVGATGSAPEMFFRALY